MNLGSGRLKLKIGMNSWLLCMCVFVLHMNAKNHIYSSFVYQEGVGAVTPQSNKHI